ncbi:putative cytochrome P450 oxidoreductase [Astrocystis sublimbata]|nr:putative cytochrome P450 oxidoreductase [Astrocystis sublimbata]
MVIILSATTVGTSILIIVAVLIIRLVRNTYKARRTGLPYTFTLLHELETWAYITDPVLRRFCRSHVLSGRGWPRWARFMIKDWHYEDKYRAHAEHGPVFLVVSPSGIVCYVADATAANNVLTRRKAFIKPPEKMKMLEPFGPNIGSSEGELWRTHSRIATPTFNESTLNSVWLETQKQAESLKSSWLRGEIEVFEGIRTSTMKTMRNVSFGSDTDDETRQVRPSAHKLSLLEALNGVVMHLPHILLVPTLILRHSPWKVAYTAYTEMDTYMDELLYETSQDIDRGLVETSSSHNLLGAILRHSRKTEAEGIDLDEKLGAKLSLSNEEIKGNLFIFLLAGYDTTANTIIYSSIILALYPDIQDKIVAEIDSYYETPLEKDSPASESVSQLLGNFPYLLSFMYEMLRVFPVIRPIARRTTTAQKLIVADGDVILPAGTDVIVNNTALHFSELDWPSPEIIDPQRWMVPDPHSFDPSVQPSEYEESKMRERFSIIPANRKGTFMTFGEGPRACLGRNFAKVEFVAFFCSLLRGCRLRLGDDVNAEQVEKELRLLSGGSPVTLVPPDLVDVKLVPA